ncbi:MAG: PaaI family thioesterase [Streptosporangiaceae bacterium]
MERLSPDGASCAALDESAVPAGRHRDVTWTDPLVGAALARDVSGLDYLRGIAAGRIPAAPIAALMGLTLVRADPGRVTFQLDVGEHLYNPIGSVHGGVFCTLLDSAMGCSVHASLSRGQAYTSLELKVNFIKPLTLDTPSVVATGEVISLGRRVATASARITGPDGTLYAHGTTTCLIFDARPGPSAPPERNGDGR